MNSRISWVLVERVSTVAVIAVSGALLWNQFGNRPTRTLRVAAPSAPIVLAGLPVIGSQSARLGLLIYSDFQCPYCGRFGRETWPRLRTEYVNTGRLFAAFSDLPLPNHSFAVGAAQAGLCAGRQQRFWEMHDFMFADQSKLDDQGLMVSATRSGIDVAKWQACRTADDTKLAIGAVLTNYGKRFGVTRTPTFMIGLMQGNGLLKVTKVLEGALPFDTFKAALDSFSKG